MPRGDNVELYRVVYWDSHGRGVTMLLAIDFEDALEFCRRFLGPPDTIESKVGSIIQATRAAIDGPLYNRWKTKMDRLGDLSKEALYAVQKEEIK